VTNSAVITAYNSFSEKTEKINNEKAQLDLNKIASNKWSILNAQGFAPNGVWESEYSILILGIDLEEAILIGKKFKPNAIVFNGNDGVLKLYDCKKGA
jgi:hypothetical protein